MPEVIKMKKPWHAGLDIGASIIIWSIVFGFVSNFIPGAPGNKILIQSILFAAGLVFGANYGINHAKKKSDVGPSNSTTVALMAALTPLIVVAFFLMIVLIFAGNQLPSIIGLILLVSNPLTLAFTTLSRFIIGFFVVKILLYDRPNRMFLAAAISLLIPIVGILLTKI